MNNFTGGQLRGPPDYGFDDRYHWRGCKFLLIYLLATVASVSGLILWLARIALFH